MKYCGLEGYYSCLAKEQLGKQFIHLLSEKQMHKSRAIKDQCSKQVSQCVASLACKNAKYKTGVQIRNTEYKRSWLLTFSYTSMPPTLLNMGNLALQRQASGLDFSG